MFVHGGPIGVSSDKFFPASPGGPCSIALLQQAGYAVFCPNYRGSVGFGLDFAEANWEDCGGKDWDDMILGLDYLQHVGLADSRLGIMGWSYGGFTTAWAISQSQRFSCAVMGAGYGSWLAFQGKAALCGLKSRWIPGVQFSDPYSALAEPASPATRFSPLSYVENMKTPTLILHGEEDIDVPVDCGYAVYRALRTHEVPVELSIYPREPHGVTERQHMVDMAQKTLRWLQQWLPPTTAAVVTYAKL